MVVVVVVMGVMVGVLHRKTRSGPPSTAPRAREVSSTPALDSYRLPRWKPGLVLPLTAATMMMMVIIIISWEGRTGQRVLPAAPLLLKAAVAAVLVVAAVARAVAVVAGRRRGGGEGQRGAG